MTPGESGVCRQKVAWRPGGQLHWTTVEGEEDSCLACGDTGEGQRDTVCMCVGGEEMDTGIK